MSPSVVSPLRSEVQVCVSNFYIFYNPLLLYSGTYFLMFYWRFVGIFQKFFFIKRAFCVDLNTQNNIQLKT